MKKEEPTESLFEHLRISDGEPDSILSNPYSRLWHDCINRALKDMWCRNKDASDSARRWIYDNDTSPINSFDNIMFSLGYNPDVFREKMMIPKERIRIKKLFKQQGFRSDLVKN